MVSLKQFSISMFFLLHFAAFAISIIFELLYLTFKIKCCERHFEFISVENMMEGEKGKENVQDHRRKKT